MKTLKHIISWVVWSLLALYVAVAIAIHIPYVQRKLGSAVATALSDKLHTEVTVGRIDLGLFNRLIIDDIVVCDQRRQPMVQARRLSVKAELLPLLTEGRVSISSAQLFSAQAHLYRDSAKATPNYQFAIDALTSKDDQASSPINLRIGSLIVRRLSLSYDQRDASPTPQRLNPSHLSMSDVSAHILLRRLTQDSINLVIKRFNLKEQSGLELQQLALKLEGNRQKGLLTDVTLQLPHTQCRIDTLSATYDLDSLAQTLRYHTRLSPSTIALSDLVPLLPAHMPTRHTLTAEADLSGTASSIHLRRLHLAEQNQQLLLDGTARWEDAAWDASVERLSLSSDLLREIYDMYPTAPSFIPQLGNLTLTGKAGGDTTGSISAQGRLSTAIGRVELQGAATGDLKRWHAHVNTDSLSLQQLTGTPELGLLAAQLDVSATEESVSIKGTIPRLDFRGYSYRHMTLDGTYSPTAISGKLKIADDHLQADVEGAYHRTAKPRYQLTGYIGRLAPQALHLSDRWGGATFAAIVDADISATSLYDAEGTLDLDDFVMASDSATHYHLDNLHMRTGHEDDRHFLRINSDFGEALAQGHFDLTTLPQDVAALIPLQEGADKAGHNDFTLTMKLTDSRWMQQLLGLPVELNGPLDFDARLDAPQRQLNIEADIPAIELFGNNLRDVAFDLQSDGDSARCHLLMTRHTDNGNSQQMSLTALAHEQELTSNLRFATPQADHGSINTVARFYTNDDGKPETHIRVLPSQLFMKSATWEMEPCDIVYGDKRLMIDQFSLHHGDEHLIVDGLLSKRSTDTLLLDLNGLDIAYLLDLVNFHSVKFGGKASGKAYVCHAFDTPQVWADISVGQFLFLDAPMGTLEAHAEWNDSEGQIDLDAAIDDGADAQTFIDGYVSPRHKALDLGIRARGTTLAFLHDVTDSFIGSIAGQVYGDIRVHGPLKEIDLSGDVLVSGHAAITPLGTTYHFAEESVSLAAGKILFNDFHVSDREGHTAALNGAINHTYLKNFTFDLSAQANGLLAYDFPRPETGATVGGTVWVDGTADMHGRSGEIVIDCDVTPSPGSVFYYNAANPDAISNQQFITWGTSHATDETPQENGDTASAADDADDSASATSGDVRVNFRINATPDAALRLIMDQHSGDLITLHGSGVLRASFYNKGPFQLFGTYDVERGSYSMTIQNIIKKTFAFQPESNIIFGGDPLQAALSLKALYTVNAVSLSDLGLDNAFTSNTIRVNCLMNIVGTAGEPRVEFDLEMPTVNSEEEQMIRSIIASEQELNQQVVYLLGIGRFYTQGTNNAATQPYGQTELAMQSLLSGTVSSQINQLLSQVIKTDDWNFGANISTGNEGWHNAEYEGLISGRMLNNRLLINGQFGYRDNAAQANPSFIGDFDIQYLLTPGGSFALKAYNQTNDRYFTHSSLNTQGIGIILKKDFNGISDLFSHRRKKAGK